MNRFVRWWRKLTRAYVCPECELRCKSPNGLSRHRKKCRDAQLVQQSAKAIRG